MTHFGLQEAEKWIIVEFVVGLKLFAQLQDSGGFLASAKDTSVLAMEAFTNLEVLMLYI